MRTRAAARAHTAPAPAPAAAAAPAEVRHALATPGEPLEARARGTMESRFGHDFSGVRVHADGRAARAAAAVDARAFAVGSHIVFGAGQYAPGTPAGAHTLAHELAHTIQQRGATPRTDGALAVADAAGAAEREAATAAGLAAGGQAVRVTGSTPAVVARQSAPAASPPAEPPELTPRLDRIAGQYRAMIADARSLGMDVAADNLQHFLDGTGGTRTLPVTWLRGFSEVTAAERTNQERFEESLDDEAVNVGAGATRTFRDYWDRSLTGGLLTELYYASGTSTIRSTGDFTLSAPVDKEVDITGTVQHHWYDPYDWHAELSAFIPGHGVISDADALLLQTHRGAAPFRMESDWTQTVAGHVTVRDYWFDSSSYTWSGP